MAVVQETIYTAWNFADGEDAQALIFPDLNYKHIQTELAVAASKKALMAIDPENPLKSQCEAEYLRGMMDALGMLLATSDNMKATLQEALQEELELQQELSRRSPSSTSSNQAS